MSVSENKHFMNSSLSNHFYIEFKFSIINIISVSVQFQYLNSCKL